MGESLEILKSIPVEVLFIVVVSSEVNKYFAPASRVKFLVPLALSLFCALATKPSPSTEMFHTWFEYVGQSMVLHQVWKKFIKKLFTKE